MNEFTSLEERLDLLGRQLESRPSFADEIMAKIGPTEIRHQPRVRRRWFPVVTAFATASVLMAIGMWVSQPRLLYAQVLDALGDVKTVHMTGWTSRVIRKWPLENPSDSKKQTTYPVEAWFWKDEGINRSYETFGPIVQVRRGNILKEYQVDADLLFISKGEPRDRVDELASMAVYLRALKDEGAVTKELGIKSDNGQSVRGLELKRNGQLEEFWVDTKTNLPSRYVRSKVEGENVETRFEVTFAYDQSVPDSILAYSPPDAQHVRYGGRHDDVQVVWKKHVQDLGVRATGSGVESVTIVPRDDQQTFSLQYTTQTPRGDYSVIPLDCDQRFPLTVQNFVNLRVAMKDGDRAFEKWRVSADLLDLEFPRCDLVVPAETPWQTWVATALDELDLEFVPVEEERIFWIAEHDGRQLKPYTEVDPPAPYVMRGGRVQKGIVRPGVGHTLRPATMSGLLSDFNRLQNLNFNARHPVVIDRTGLPQAPPFNLSLYSSWGEFENAVNYRQYLVANDSPWFHGEDALKMARTWYEEEFGVTFRVEKRPAKVNVIRRRK